MKRVMLMVALSLGCTVAQAAGLSQGDAEKGKSKAAACGACHGADGNSANGEWPKLAGQHAKYLVEQLQAYKSGTRKNAIMLGQSVNLSEQDMQDLAAYFSAQTLKPGVADPALVEQAAAIYRGGKADAGVTACSACHGPKGLGNAAAGYPRISGQHAKYTAMQLKAYRDGTRGGTALSVMMSNVSAGLSDAEIDALASYLAGLH